MTRNEERDLAGLQNNIVLDPRHLTQNEERDLAGLQITSFLTRDINNPLPPPPKRDYLPLNKER